MESRAEQESWRAEQNSRAGELGKAESTAEGQEGRVEQDSQEWESRGAGQEEERRAD